ncbi:hypothetical protein NHQ30_008935, partial [Ciborinia camelliae]
NIEGNIKDPAENRPVDGFSAAIADESNLGRRKECSKFQQSRVDSISSSRLHHGITERLF